MEPVVCPNCGNTSESKNGISFAFLEWRVMPVVAARNGTVIVNYAESEASDVDPKAVTTMTNTPNNRADLQHLFCNACNHSWFDPRPDADVADEAE